MIAGTAHLIVAPIVVPLLAGALLLVVERVAPRAQAALSFASVVTLAVIATLLLGRAESGAAGVYLLGNWAAPFGISLVLDRLSALMLALTATIALPALLAAQDGWSRRGPHFHALFQFQLAGLNGAFLTGDLFNLFVFFEVLLIASYALLLHAAGGRALKAGFHYVVVNLVGSSLFLVAASLIYGLTGTLNLADIASKVAAAPAWNHGLLQAAGLLLLVVFALKAAIVPLGFWLPSTYGSAPAPVAALFALMTKVGVYAILRVTTLVFGADGGPLAGLGATTLVVAGVATIVVGALGAIAADGLSRLAAFLVVVSAGTLVAAVALGGAMHAGALYYLVHSTVAAALMFLVVDAIGRQRPATGDRVASCTPLAQPALLGALFLGAAVAVAGLPPLSGFIGKVALLAPALGAPGGAAFVAALLGSGFVAMFTLARAGSVVFWKTQGAAGDAGRVGVGEGAAFALLAAAALGLMVFAGPVQRYAEATAQELSNPAAYVDRVLGARPVAKPGGAR
jgi:multicomponent K+:H+ antiporter subunit D